MAEAQHSSTDRPKVFISYSRHDGGDLAEELVPGLALAGFEAYLDKHDIEKAVDWEERLNSLIRKADSVVFIISPASVRSPRCKWEVDRALELAKRLIPVQWIKVDEAEVPERLRRLNYTIFAQGQSFARPLSELVAALRQDVEWIRTHTLIGEQAARWQGRGGAVQAGDLLLRGSELCDSRTWLGRRRDDAPAITDLQRAYLEASEAAEIARASSEKTRLAERDHLVKETDIAQARTRYLQIAFDAAFRPSRVAPLIEFNDKASLKAAAFFWVSLTAISSLLNASVLAFYGTDATFGNIDSGNSFAHFAQIIENLTQKYQFVAILYAMLFYIVFSAFWYAGIRCLIKGSQLPYLGFFQCSAYPAGVMGLLSPLFMIAIQPLYNDMHSKDFNAAQVLADMPQLKNNIFVAKQCATVSSFDCQSAVAIALHPGPFATMMIGGLMMLGWEFLNVSTIIKGVTGLRRRRTLVGGGLVAFLLYILLAGVFGVVYAFIHKGSA